MAGEQTIGIIGGTGQLGSAIARGWLSCGVVAPEHLWIANRSGESGSLADQPGLRFTSDNAELVAACDTVLLSVPPAQFHDLSIEAADTLILSVMAGVTIADMKERTGARRVIRGMSSPAASRRLAYSPWCAGEGATASDRETAAILYGACGTADEVRDESHIDIFTAITGPVPGFVAYFARCVSEYATARGIAPQIADRAVRQLFLAGGTILAEDEATAGEHVREMIDYAGTTAAGLLAMDASLLSQAVADGLDAAVERTRSIGKE
ncbi:pyrroline-5-carboxylate reductase family protein [Tepidamorphus sp. 3E244]|uniref:pyrroline-5-carboxylate reductase family protein n=1 Tax=Tepidamorphus sp. 3E244 TaxID=3385498 RepID=UPI0038FBF487